MNAVKSIKINAMAVGCSCWPATKWECVLNMS